MKYFGAMSIEQIQPGVVRHPEISYFRETIYDEESSLDNRKAFFSVSFSKVSPELFKDELDPEPSSLFNVATMRRLV